MRLPRNQARQTTNPALWGQGITQPAAEQVFWVLGEAAGPCSAPSLAGGEDQCSLPGAGGPETPGGLAGPHTPRHQRGSRSWQPRVTSPPHPSAASSPLTATLPLSTAFKAAQCSVRPAKRSQGCREPGRGPRQSRASTRVRRKARLKAKPREPGDPGLVDLPVCPRGGPPQDGHAEVHDPELGPGGAVAAVAVTVAQTLPYTENHGNEDATDGTRVPFRHTEEGVRVREDLGLATLVFTVWWPRSVLLREPCCPPGGLLSEPLGATPPQGLKPYPGPRILSQCNPPAPGPPGRPGRRCSDPGTPPPPPIPCEAGFRIELLVLQRVSRVSIADGHPGPVENSEPGAARLLPPGCPVFIIPWPGRERPPRGDASRRARRRLTGPAVGTHPDRLARLAASGGHAALRGCFGLLKAYSNPERGTQDLLAPDTTLQTQNQAALTPGPRTGLSALTTAVLRAKAWDHPARRADRAPPPCRSELISPSHCPLPPGTLLPASWPPSQTLEPLPHAPDEVQTGMEDSQDAPSVPSQANTATSAAEVLGGRSGSFGLSSGSPKAEPKKLLKSCAPQRRDPSAPDIASQPPPLGLRTGTKRRRYPSSPVLRMGGKSGGPGLGERWSSRLCGGGAASSPTPPQGHGGPRGSPSLLRAHWSPCEKRPATRPPQLGGRTSWESGLARAGLGAPDEGRPGAQAPQAHTAPWGLQAGPGRALARRKEGQDGLCGDGHLGQTESGRSFHDPPCQKGVGPAPEHPGEWATGSKQPDVALWGTQHGASRLHAGHLGPLGTWAPGPPGPGPASPETGQMLHALASLSVPARAALALLPGVTLGPRLPADGKPKAIDGPTPSSGLLETARP
ncbi:collagen alpha-1(III) chain-like [Prionailurus viverrinus]|uniref:collagen alpha-1(III) chain-like n=1 Tax=Prionailurus viverrinus TaxID=61388 RepID=UPI001FF48AED|nr:collagen alpha-1(III) chain-like [Prionailurus viverrinus]